MRSLRYSLGRFSAFILTVAFLLALGTKNAKAELLASTYDLGDNYSLHLGSKSLSQYHFNNVVGLTKSDVISDGDTLAFTLAKPDQSSGSGTHLGIVYTKPLSQTMTGSFSLLSDPIGDIAGTQDVAVAFHIYIKLQ